MTDVQADDMIALQQVANQYLQDSNDTLHMIFTVQSFHTQIFYAVVTLIIIFGLVVATVCSPRR